MAEIAGLAEGSGEDVATLFVLTLHEEFRHIAQRPRSLDHCTDLAVCGREFCGVVHNEDGDLIVRNNSYFLDVELGGEKFFVYAYAGSLPTDAFAFNADGVGFTSNYVEPAVLDPAGAGRSLASGLAQTRSPRYSRAGAPSVCSRFVTVFEIVRTTRCVGGGEGGGGEGGGVGGGEGGGGEGGGGLGGGGLGGGLGGGGDGGGGEGAR